MLVVMCWAAGLVRSGPHLVLVGLNLLSIGLVFIGNQVVGKVNQGSISKVVLVRWSSIRSNIWFRYFINFTHGRIHFTDSDKCSPWHSYFQCIGPNPLSDHTSK